MVLIAGGMLLRKVNMETLDAEFEEFWDGIKSGAPWGDQRGLEEVIKSIAREAWMDGYDSGAYDGGL